MEKKEAELTSAAARRSGPAALTIASLAGLGISLFHYLAPMTGVTGTAGALLVVVSSILLALAGVVLFFRRFGGFALLVRILALLGALGTGVAAWFLHAFWLVAVMAVALAAVIADLALAKGGDRS